MTATANGLSSSAIGPSEVKPAGSPSAAGRPHRAGLDLLEAGLLPSLPAAWLAGRDRDLLAPLTLVEPGSLPGPADTAAPPPDRRELAAALAVANGYYGHPRAAELAAKLADPATQVVVTGQQPGLFGGPFYTLVKMVAAAKWAAALEEAGRPAVAVFWLANEDHDWAEISAANVLGPDGLRTLDLGPDREPLAPAGMRMLGPEIETALAGLAAALPGDAGAAWAATLGRWYRPAARFGEAFSRLFPHLLGERCPLILDAMLPALKEAERPALRALVERRREVEAAFATRDTEIEARGHRLQVAPQRGVSPLFLLQGRARRRIEWQGEDGFTLRGAGGPVRHVAELLAAIADNPGVVSPGVLARPAVQDAALGTCLQVLGPGELSYIAQAAAVYPVLQEAVGLPAAPSVTLRPQALVLEERLLARTAEIPLAALLGDRAALDQAIARHDRDGGSGGDSDDPVALARRQVEQAIAGLEAPALALDPNLERPLAKTREQVLRALDLFAEKAAAAAARKNEVLSRRAEQVREAALPGGKLQERAVATAWMAGRHPRLAESLWRDLELDPRRLQVIGQEAGS
jgi:bacillithiol synthase